LPGNLGRRPDAPMRAVPGGWLAWCAGTGRHTAAVRAVPHQADAALRLLAAAAAAYPGAPPGPGPGMRAAA
jgi:hypothetical protein